MTPEKMLRKVRAIRKQLDYIEEMLEDPTHDTDLIIEEAMELNRGGLRVVELAIEYAKGFSLGRV